MLVPPIARCQDGVFSRRQAGAAGLTNWVINHRLAEGVWTRVLAEVYVLTGVPITARMQARAAQLTTGAMVSHASAAVIHGLGLADPDQPHVTTNRRLHVGARGVVEHRLQLAPLDHTHVDGIAVTTRRRTIVDLLAASPVSGARTLLFRAIQQSWITPQQLDEDVAKRRYMTGTPQLRDLSALLGTGAHSVAERLLHDILRSIEGVRWRANVSLTLSGGVSAVVDVLIDGIPLALEVDGRQFHGIDRFQHDRTRQNALVNDGYVVLRFTWIDLVERPEHVRRTIESQVHRLRARP